MKTTLAALAFAAFAVSGFANAATTSNADQAVAVQTQQANANRAGYAPKTRADVRHELVQAQMNGQIAGLQNLYRGS
ncbi:hypothetical protein AWB67_03022 [Caballeronia terrestris]|uniref:DUF4148 domain-containing protein n=1 Tax=Caballeronia terrestris TaxID=1226301 RepID=A0A158IYH3_9BURK|nr:DUF4148 domain-containing protein [Caballeronia terrestris]SAL61130.1 hypothetical protein AWB67_03022 [Caballeronia terrestris]